MMLPINCTQGWLPVLFLLLAFPVSLLADPYANRSLAVTPPRGWNSYDSYSWIISEDEFLRNAQLVAEKLLPSGYEYVVVDFLWYRRRGPGASVATPGFDTIDQWGRPIPDPTRWPSSVGGKGFKPVADQVHAMGLKFGIHVMRGISTQAVKVNTPILGTQNPIWRARDIALQNQPCSWMAQCFVSVNQSSEGGKAFIKSLYDLYALWEVDYVKHDCVFGVDDLNVEEITAVSQVIKATDRPMIYSISPGVHATPSMAQLINGLVNMYRVTGDDWDSWNNLLSHFDVARDFAAAGLVGAAGLLGLSWPDLDMLPIGYLTDPGANYGPHRFSQLTLDEQRTQVTLWAMAKSPLMFGGDLINLDETTLGLLTDPTVLEINANSFGNMEISNAIQSVIPPVHLLECKDARETLWSLRYNTLSREHDQLWWIAAHKGELVHEGCLRWEPSTIVPISEVPEAYTRRETVNVLGQASIYNSFGEKKCLDAQAKTSERITSLTGVHFSLCSQDRNQIWHLKPDGKLVNKATDLCAVVNSMKPNVSSDQGQGTNTRVWMARGLEGEYYVAFFNLGQKASTVSVPLENIIGASLPDMSGTCSMDGNSPIQDYECTGREVWTDIDINTVGGSLSASIASHGCALFSLQCSVI